MPSFERKSERPPAAHFHDVTEGKLRAPSWVATQRTGFKRVAPEPVPEPAPRLRHSERPPSIAELVAEAERRTEPSILPPPPPEPEVDPALVDAFLAAIDALGRARVMVLDDSAREIAELAVTIARRVIARELVTDPSIVEGLVDEGLRALGQHDRVTVRLGSRFGRAATAIERRLSATEERVDLVLDPTLDAYGCVIETDLGRVDESVESRLSALLAALESDSPPPRS